MKMRYLITLCLFVASLLSSSVFATEEKNCLSLLVKFNDAQEYRFLQEIKGFHSTMAPEIKAMMENEETSTQFFIEVLNLKNMHKAMKDAFRGDNDELKLITANRFVETTSQFLNRFNIEHEILEEQNVKFIHFNKQGTTRIATLIRRMSGAATAEVYFNPYAVSRAGARAMYSLNEDKLYISVDAIIKFNHRGDLESLLKPAASEFHEFLHARFQNRRNSGIDHALNTFLMPKQNYRETGYEKFMAMEELAVYLNQVNDYAARIAHYERNYNTMDWMQYRRGLLSIIYPAHYFERSVRPMAQNILTYAQRMKDSLMSGQIGVSRPNRQVLNIETSNGKGTFIIRSEGVMELHFKGENEDSLTYFYDRELISLMFRLGSNNNEEVARRVLGALLERSELQIEYATRAIGLASKFRKYHRALDRAILNGNPHRVRTEFEKIRTLLTSSRNLLIE